MSSSEHFPSCCRAKAQDSESSSVIPPERFALGDASDRHRQFIEQQIRDLSHASYRTRQLARWRLEQSPAETIEAIRACIGSVEYNTGAQLIALLAHLATHGDVATSVQSREALRENANELTAIGRLADNAMRAIADLQEEQAFQILVHHGAQIGLPEQLQFNLNARLMHSDDLAIRIGPDFDGDDQTLQWIQFLKSIETVFLEGPSIDSRYFRAISRLPNVKNVKLKHVSVAKSDLEWLKSFTALELLELNYVNLGDDALATLAELPISQSLRLYGPQFTQAGAEKLAKQLDGIEIYCGKGGYLGVATQAPNTIVTNVIAGSGAQRAGIMIDDELMKIDEVPIKTFLDLRTELGKHVAGDSIKITIRRKVSQAESIELELNVTLGEDPS